MSVYNVISVTPDVLALLVFQSDFSHEDKQWVDVVFWDLKTGRMAKYSDVPAFPQDSYPTQIYVDSDYFWYGTTNIGAVRIDKDWLLSQLNFRYLAD